MSQLLQTFVRAARSGAFDGDQPDRRVVANAAQIEADGRRERRVVRADRGPVVGVWRDVVDARALDGQPRLVLACGHTAGTEADSVVVVRKPRCIGPSTLDEVMRAVVSQRVRCVACDPLYRSER